ncbi:hypothetical protein GJAV_G00207910 [Gymnothorax javanicus]|nr:hypothetical protein GJAV_G00207910 [Gymnothorax javanicus]
MSLRRTARFQEDPPRLPAPTPPSSKSKYYACFPVKSLEPIHCLIPKRQDDLYSDSCDRCKWLKVISESDVSCFLIPLSFPAFSIPCFLLFTLGTV